MGRKLIKIFSFIVFGTAAVLGLFLAYMIVTDYRPPAELNVDMENNQELVLERGVPFSLTTFNIGYCGLDKNQDFFMDGGTMSRSSSREQTLVNLSGILEFLQRENSDFLLLQEIDIKSSRSYDINQYEAIQGAFGDYGSLFALNYLVKWVPVPVMRPMGYVKSGIGLFSRYKIDSSRRYQLPGSEAWPRQLFDLDRCMTKSVIPVEDGNKLVLVNLHLSAYDKGGRVREQQLKFLKEYIQQNYEKGYYVIIGGDWNHLLAPDRLEEPGVNENWPEWLVMLPEDFTPQGFQWVVDESVKTVRDNKTRYIEGETFTAIIDGFLVSPNIEILDVHGHDLGFEHSDHNPVTCVLRLK
ncbi:MAG: endonuclease/exonuclease/phosphatase family protein [Bacillota bacterium]